MPTWGPVHYIRFCLRQDLADALPGHSQSMEFAPVKDFPDGQPRNGLDIMLVCKRWLADQNYAQVIALFPAGEVSKMARHFNPGPNEIAERRPIGEDVKKNLRAMAPRCKATGDISEDAEAYLLQWCDGQLPLTPPPVRHALLSYQCPGFAFPDSVGTWAPPTRWRHLKLTLPNSDEINPEEEDSDVEEGMVALETWKQKRACAKVGLESFEV